MHTSNVDGTTDFNLNINGGNYYATGIGRYGTITSGVKNTKVTINNAEIYYESTNKFPIFDDWKGGMSVKVYNSTIVCPNSLFFTKAGGGQTAYFENSTVLVTSLNTTVTLGEGNLISATGSVNLADGVKMSEKNINTSVLLNYPQFIKKAPLASDGKTEQLEGTNFKKEVIDGVTYYTLADSVYNKETWKNEIKYYSGAYITYSGDTEPDVFADVVNYCWPNGDVFATTRWHKDSANIDIANAAVAPNTTVDIGMYKINSLKWTANGENSFVLSNYAVAGDFSDMKVNATLKDGMIYNIYVPADKGVKVTGTDVGTVASELVEIEGKQYYKVSVELKAGDFNKISLKVNFSAESLVGGADKSGTQTLVADVVKYATDVASQYECGSEEANLALEMMNYKEAVAKAFLAEGAEYTRTADTEAFYEIYANHTECKCGITMEVSESEVADLAGLVDAGISGAGFDMDSVGTIKMVLYSENAELDVKVSYNTGLGTVEIKAAYSADSNGYVTEGIPAAYIDNILTITVGEAEGTYCLAAYIAAEGTTEVAKNVATALYEYAMAAEAYKHVTKTEAEAAQ